MRLCAMCYVQSGAYILQLMDDCATNWGLLIIALLETIAIFWIYGKRCCLLSNTNRRRRLVVVDY